MQFFQILAEFLQIFVDLIPRVTRRPASTEHLIVDSWIFGVQLMARPCVVWPICDIVEYWSSVEIPIDPDIQTITGPSGNTITVRTGFSYTIFDPVTTRDHWGEDYNERIAMLCRSKVEWWYATHDFIEHALRRDFQINVEIRNDLKFYGVDIDWFCVEEQAVTPAHRIYGIEPIIGTS